MCKFSLYKTPVTYMHYKNVSFLRIHCEGFTTPKVWEWKIFSGVKDKSCLFIYHRKAAVDPGEGPGGPGAPPPRIFERNWGRKGRWIFFWDRPFPRLILGSGWPPPHLPLILGSGWPPLILGSGWPPPSPPYLRVWMTAPPISPLS